ncbi:MAG: AmmeMemoRadiSam system protein A [Candidatus Omnitrophica bacterium]|nr:AmmeMemoRadiSam system protein A [Candidatus Omnitrophota bacterium]
MGLLTVEQKKRLIEIARQTIKYKLEKGKDLKIDESDETLNRKMGAFVTLHEDGQLRGCIGNLIGSKALYLTIQEMALEAALRDPRFTPLKLNELNKIEIEISVLSPLEKVDSCEDIILSTHGVLIQKGMRSGVFLPQVAEETGWSKEEFLSCLCSHKAGLPPDAWKDPSTEIYIFTAEVFSEKHL